MSGGTNGASARLASGETREIRPNASADTGKDASVAAVVVASCARNHAGPGTRRSSGSARSSSPAGAGNDSRKPTYRVAPGDTGSSTTTAPHSPPNPPD